MVPAESKIRTAKILILGTADAGKSTLIRHMRKLHGREFESLEMAHFKKVIRLSCLEYLVAIVKKFLKDEQTTKPYHGACENFLEHYKSISVPDREFIEMALNIWRLVALQSFITKTIHLDSYGIDSNNMAFEFSHIHGDAAQTIEMSFEGKRIHSDNPLSHFLKCFERIMEKDYKPDLEDILNLRVPTSGKFHKSNVEMILYDSLLILCLLFLTLRNIKLHLYYRSR